MNSNNHADFYIQGNNNKGKKKSNTGYNDNHFLRDCEPDSRNQAYVNCDINNNTATDRYSERMKSKNKNKTVQIAQLEEDEITDKDLASFRFYGILLLCGTTLYFVIGMGSLFNIWSPLYQRTSGRKGQLGGPMNRTMDYGFPVDNYYTYVILLCPAIFWVWCIVSWVGMKLFRHAKGIANT